MNADTQLSPKASSPCYEVEETLTQGNRRNGVQPADKPASIQYFHLMIACQVAGSDRPSHVLVPDMYGYFRYKQ